MPKVVELFVHSFKDPLMRKTLRVIEDHLNDTAQEEDAVEVPVDRVLRVENRDDDGRITRFTSGNTVVTITYEDDRIVVRDGSKTTTANLDSEGRITTVV